MHCLEKGSYVVLMEPFCLFTSTRIREPRFVSFNIRHSGRYIIRINSSWLCVTFFFKRSRSAASLLCYSHVSAGKNERSCNLPMDPTPSPLNLSIVSGVMPFGPISSSLLEIHSELVTEFA